MVEEIRDLLQHCSLAELKQLKLIVAVRIDNKEKQAQLAAQLWPKKQ